MNLTVPQRDTKPKKTYTVNIEGDKYIVKASVLIFRDATKCYNKIFKATNKEYENYIEAISDVSNMLDDTLKLFEILLGETQAEKLISKIDKKYDAKEGQFILMQYAGLLYNISTGDIETQEDIDNFFRSQQENKSEEETE